LLKVAWMQDKLKINFLHASPSVIHSAPFNWGDTDEKRTMQELARYGSESAKVVHD
jgi:hypothetical protein